MMIFIYIKRCLKHFSIILMLLSVPLLAFVFRDYVNKATDTLVGIYAENSGDKIVNELVSDTNYLHFIFYDNKEKMKHDVETQLLECGFVLPPDLDGVMEDDIKIVCGTGYSSVLSAVTKEAVFAEILKYYGGNLAYNFVEKNDINITKDDFDTAYSKYLSEIKSAVVFEELPAAKSEQSYDYNILQCITAVITICAGLIGASFFIKDRKNGFYADGSGNIAAMLTLFFLALLLSGFILKKQLDIPRTLLLNIGVWGMCSILAHLFKDERMPWLFMPLCIAFVVAFDFLRLSSVIPSLGLADSFLISHYYIYGAIPNFVLFSAVLCVGGIIANKLLR